MDRGMCGFPSGPGTQGPHRLTTCAPRFSNLHRRPHQTPRAGRPSPPSPCTYVLDARSPQRKAGARIAARGEANKAEGAGCLCPGSNCTYCTLSFWISKLPPRGRAVRAASGVDLACRARTAARGRGARGSVDRAGRRLEPAGLQTVDLSSGRTGMRSVN
jgi:hypothetical protein